MSKSDPRCVLCNTGKDSPGFHLESTLEDTRMRCKDHEACGHRHAAVVFKALEAFIGCSCVTTFCPHNRQRLGL